MNSPGLTEARGWKEVGVRYTESEEKILHTLEVVTVIEIVVDNLEVGEGVGEGVVKLIGLLEIGGSLLK